jgi:hypothetical protein
VPATPPGAKVDATTPDRHRQGWGLDETDESPDTPLGTRQLRLRQDSDGDGVVDGADRCPDTPAGVSVM